jgi:hypothetical protein
VLEDGSPARLHRARLDALLASTKGTIRVATAYVTDGKLLGRPDHRERRLLISLTPMDVASGATNLGVLASLITTGVRVRVLPSSPRLHAKVYAFGLSRAVVTSANLTERAFGSNIEAGIEVPIERVPLIVDWFDELWRRASTLTVGELSKLENRTRALRAQYRRLKLKAQARLRLPRRPTQETGLHHPLKELFTPSRRCFVCNTDRLDGRRTPTNGFLLEEKMHDSGFAAAWEEFKFPNHMEQVKAGDAILMFARGVGIIGIGIAKGPYKTLLPGDPKRLGAGPWLSKVTEWRIPVDWLEWDQADAFRCSGQRATFYDVSGLKYDALRAGVLKHFSMMAET